MSRAQLTSTVEQNTGGAVAPFLAGKNKIINGDFGIWARGTSFSNPGGFAYTADRWSVNYSGSGGTIAYSQQAFTPGSAPVAGYESAYYFQANQSVAASSQTFNVIDHRIEDVRTFAGQTVTISFWAKAAAATNITFYLSQIFGTGGSSAVTPSTSTQSIGTSWARYSYTVTLPSISGKTIGTNSYLQLEISLPTNSTFTLSFWGVQVEAGSVATPFTTASGTLQGELALCQRYYWRGATTTSNFYGQGTVYSTTTNAAVLCPFPTQMRITPSSVDYSNLKLTDPTTTYSVSAVALDAAASTPRMAFLYLTNAAITAYRPVLLGTSDSSAGYLGFNAEL